VTRNCFYQTTSESSKGGTNSVKVSHLLQPNVLLAIKSVTSPNTDIGLSQETQARVSLRDLGRVGCDIRKLSLFVNLCRRQDILHIACASFTGERKRIKPLLTKLLLEERGKEEGERLSNDDSKNQLPEWLSGIYRGAIEIWWTWFDSTAFTETNLEFSH
jgi:hypothetical protein